MGNLMAYSAIVTKIKAMERWRLTDRQFEEMAALESVPEAVAYLKENPSYESLFSSFSQEELHRGKIEQQLNQALYRDFMRIYRFANLRQRRFLELYFRRYELSILKTCLRGIAGGMEQELKLEEFGTFFQEHSKLDLHQICQKQTLEQWIASLKGSSYYAPLAALEQKGNVSPTDCETVLDMSYFTSSWRINKRYLKKDEQKIITQCFGTRMDMLNIQWIYRSKKYYHLEPADIYSLLIPVNYRLKQDEITKLAEAGNLDEFFTILAGTHYGALSRTDLRITPDLEALYEQVMNRIYSMTARKHPYSAAVLNSYFYFKNLEIHRLITAIECIRYGVDPNEILSYIIKDTKGGNGK